MDLVLALIIVLLVFSLFGGFVWNPLWLLVLLVVVLLVVPWHARR